MKQKKHKVRIRVRRCGAAMTAVILALCLVMLTGCSKENNTETQPTSDTTAQTDSPTTTSTEAEPVTLEQELLKRRSKPYDQSDYKKLTGGENIIDPYAEFDCIVDRSYSTTINSIIVSGKKVCLANFNSLLPNGKNVQEVGTLPGIGEILYWRFTYDGEIGSVYFKDGTGYKVSCAPFSATELDTAQYPLFKKVYRYASDGKTLEDHTAEYLAADKVYDYCTPMISLTEKKVSLIFPGQYLYDDTDWNWYWDMGWREYIAFDLDLSEIGSETPIRLFNSNILMTNCAFYEIVYASEPLSDNDEKAQLAPDGSVSPYYPAYSHLNCNLKLRELQLLTNYYSDVRNICTSHVITDDYTLLPIEEVITDGYNQYVKYDCSGFYWDYIGE